MGHQLPPIVKLAERLQLEIEQAVRAFARYHKYALGSDLRDQARQVVRVCHRAWRERSRQLYWTDQLIWAVDEIKVSLQMGSRLHVFKSFRQFEMLIRIAEDLGRQAGGWKRQQVSKGQNPARDAAPKRAQILSTRDASLQGANQ